MTEDAIVMTGFFAFLSVLSICVTTIVLKRMR